MWVQFSEKTKQNIVFFREWGCVCEGDTFMVPWMKGDNLNLALKTADERVACPWRCLSIGFFSLDQSRDTFLGAWSILGDTGGLVFLFFSTYVGLAPRRKQGDRNCFLFFKN